MTEFNRRTVLRAAFAVGAATATTGLVGGPARAATTTTGVVNGPWFVSVGVGVLQINPEDPEARNRVLQRGDDATSSPDGQRVAYVESTSDGIVNVFVWNRVTGEIRQVTGNTVPLSDTYSWPTWSPDGRKLAVVKNRDTLLILKLDTGETRRALVKAGLSTPDWSPDGSRIAFRCQGSNGRSSLRVLTLNGGTVQRVHDAPEGIFEPLTEAVFTPDSQRLVFKTYRWTQGLEGSVAELASVRLDGTDFQRLTNGPRFYLSPVYSPDGRYLAALSIPPENTAPDGGNIIVFPSDFSSHSWIPGDEYDDSTRVDWARAI